MTPPKITVAICSRNRPDLLRKCLAAVKKAGGFAEILVIDNRSDGPETHAVVLEFGARYIYEPVIGVEYARNRATTEARGQVILFTDDDCQPLCGWVEAIADAFDDPDVVGVFGRTVLSFSNRVQTEFDRLRRPWPTSTVTISQKSIHPFWYQGVVGVGANMAFRRQFLLTSGGFPPSSYSAADDDYMMIHALLSGWKLRFTPNAIVAQYHRATGLEAAKRMYEYGVCASRMIWLLGSFYNRMRLASLNQAWIFAQNFRKTLLSLVHLHWLQVAFRCSYILGLFVGLLTPQRQGLRQGCTSAKWRIDNPC